MIQPCPFCGDDEPVAVTEGEPGHESSYVACMTCAAAGPPDAESAKAIEMWNRANGARLLATVVRDLGGELLFDTDLESRPVRIEQRGDGWSAVLGDA